MVRFNESFKLTEQQVYTPVLEWCRDAKPGDVSDYWDADVYPETTLRARVSSFQNHAAFIYEDERRHRKYKVKREWPEVEGQKFRMMRIVCYVEEN